MDLKFSDDKNTNILTALLKTHGIRKVIASPGTTNVSIVANMMYDPWFEMYSSVDERSAAYMACGLASASNEPVVITCTGATASRNYFPGITEAYYRKLPILVLAGSYGEDIIGHLHAQSLDRTQEPHDTVRFVTCIKKKDNEWKATIEANKAILELKRHGGGPVLINLESAAYGTFTTDRLPTVRNIERYMPDENFPSLNVKRIAIFIGAHRNFTNEETSYIDEFCSQYNGAVFCDHTSGYNGKFKVLGTLSNCQLFGSSQLTTPDLLIHLGEISANFFDTGKLHAKETWRVSEDGELKDLFTNLTNVFEMSESTFFKAYLNSSCNNNNSEYYECCTSARQELVNKIPELPFGNIWIAKQLHDKLPTESTIHFSIFNSYRSWSFFPLDKTISSNCNVGGFGIDGPMSTLIGASLANPDKLHFGIIGDLAFFYDLNSLGNRHVSNNIRILLVNNGKGTEFRIFNHPANQWGEKADLFMAAGGHFGNKSGEVVKCFVQALGFDYYCASTKEEFMDIMPTFVLDKKTCKPIVFEVFVDFKDDSDALETLRTLIPDERNVIQKMIDAAKNKVVDTVVGVQKKLNERLQW